MHGGLVSKYDGLLRLTDAEFPHPRWMFFATREDVPLSPWARDECGWSIRLCPVDRYIFNLPSRHYIRFSDVPLVVADLLATIPGERMVAVVYPSWRFWLAGGCHVTADTLIIEVVVGSLAGLLAGKQSPECVYLCSGPLFSSIQVIAGDSSLLPRSYLLTMRDYCKRLSPHVVITLEWSITETGRLLFHDWIEE